MVGLALFGGGDVTLLSGSQIALGEGLLRLLLICVYLSVRLAALGAVGLFVSTLTEQPIGATIAIMLITVRSFILDAIPQLAWLHPYLLTHWWLASATCCATRSRPNSCSAGWSPRPCTPALLAARLGPVREQGRHVVVPARCGH